MRALTIPLLVLLVTAAPSVSHPATFGLSDAEAVRPTPDLKTAQIETAEPTPDSAASEASRALAALQAMEDALWAAAEGGGEVVDYEAYLDRFPEGRYAGQAQQRIETLRAAGAAAPDARAAEARLRLARKDRRDIQERLTMLGHDTRGIDGVFGPATRAAIVAWQKTAELAPTGYLDVAQLARLRSATNAGIAAWRAEQGRRTPDAAPARTENPGPEPSSGPTIYEAVAECATSRHRGEGRHADQARALLIAAQQCVRNGGSPRCCADGAAVTNR